MNEEEMETTPLVDRYDLLSQAFLNLNPNPYLLSGAFTSPLGIER